MSDGAEVTPGWIQFQNQSLATERNSFAVEFLPKISLRKCVICQVSERERDMERLQMI